MAHAVELRNFPEDEKDFAAARPPDDDQRNVLRNVQGDNAQLNRNNVQPFPTTGLPLSYSTTTGEELNEVEDLEGSIYDNSLYAEPTRPPRTLLNRAFAAASAALDACTPYPQAAIHKLKTAGKRVNEKKEERPLQFIGAVAGMAFALGMVVRFWRSRS